MYAHAVDATDDAYQSLRNYKWAASKIDLSRRRDKVSFAIHREIAALPREAQDAMLERAEAENRKVNDHSGNCSALSLRIIKQSSQNRRGRSVLPSATD